MNNYWKSIIRLIFDSSFENSLSGIYVSTLPLPEKKGQIIIIYYCPPNNTTIDWNKGKTKVGKKKKRRGGRKPLPLKSCAQPFCKGNNYYCIIVFYFHQTRYTSVRLWRWTNVRRRLEREKEKERANPLPQAQVQFSSSFASLRCWLWRPRPCSQHPPSPQCNWDAVVHKMRRVRSGQILIRPHEEALLPRLWSPPVEAKSLQKLWAHQGMYRSYVTPC